MNPALQVASQAAQHAAIFSHHFYRDEIHAQLHLSRSSQFGVFRAHVLVFKLTPAFIALLGASSTATSLLLPFQGDHIRVSHRHDAPRIIQAIPIALARLTHAGQLWPNSPEHTVIGENARGLPLLVVIKFPPRPQSGNDEALVKTAYFAREREIRRLVKLGRIKPLPRQGA